MDAAHPRSYVSRTASRAEILRLGLRHFALTAAATAIFSFVIAVSGQAQIGNPQSAVKLSASSVKQVTGGVCGEAGGRWISGRLVSSGRFVSDQLQARRFAARSRHAHGRARTATLARARYYVTPTKKLAPICRRVAAATVVQIPTTGAPIAGALSRRTGSVVTAPGTYISPQFFGQHLMWLSALTPAVPVHALRLWDSNTQWCQIDNGTASNQYNFGQLDALLGQASRLGADVEFTFGGTPQWAANGAYPQSSVVDQCSHDSMAAAPANESYWTSFVTALVAHAKGKIHAYELWNEADYSLYWSGSIAEIVKLSVAASAIIHAIDPSALVLSPSITATSEGYTFLKQYLSRIPAGTIDAIALHGYTFGDWPEDSVPVMMRAVRSALPTAYADTPLWSTEGGWGANSWFSTAATDQRAFVARYDLMMLTEGAVRAYWYAYPNTQWGTLWEGAPLTPAGTATRTVNSWLVGATLAGCDTTDGNLWTCNLTTSTGKKARIVWAKSWPVWYFTVGYSRISRLDGRSSLATRRIQVWHEPVMLSS